MTLVSISLLPWMIFNFMSSSPTKCPKTTPPMRTCSQLMGTSTSRSPNSSLRITLWLPEKLTQRNHSLFILLWSHQPKMPTSSCKQVSLTIKSWPQISTKTLCLNLIPVRSMWSVSTFMTQLDKGLICLWSCPKMTPTQRQLIVPFISIRKLTKLISPKKVRRYAKVKAPPHVKYSSHWPTLCPEISVCNLPSSLRIQL